MPADPDLDFFHYHHQKPSTSYILRLKKPNSPKQDPIKPGRDALFQQAMLQFS